MLCWNCSNICSTTTASLPGWLSTSTTTGTTYATNDGRTNDGRTNDGATNDGATNDGATNDGRTNDGRTTTSTYGSTRISNPNHAA
jgi:hypothetical protein